MRAWNRQLSQHEYHFQHNFIQDDTLSRAAVIEISTKCWATKVIELCTRANIHREASGIIIMLVIILIYLLVPGEITNLNY